MAETRRYEIKEGALEPPVEGTLRQADGSPVPFPPGTTVSFVMRQVNGAKAIDSDAEILDEDAGTVRYAWVDEDTDTPGAYRAEFWVVLPGDRPRVVPSDGWIDLLVIPNQA